MTRYGWKWLAVALGGASMLFTTHFAGATTGAVVPPGTDSVGTIEFNYFGTPPNVRCAVIFRDPDGSIVDWRWCNDRMEPAKLADGTYVMVWDDMGMPRTVYAKRVIVTRTLEDQELKERASLPEHKRRKLSRVFSSTVTPAPPAPAPVPPAPAPMPPPPPPPMPLPPAAATTPTPTPAMTVVNSWAW